MISTIENSLLFDDRLLLESALGKDALKVSSVNANCDCDSSPALSTNRDYVSYVTPASDCDGISNPSPLRYDARDPN